MFRFKRAQNRPSGRHLLKRFWKFALASCLTLSLNSLLSPVFATEPATRLATVKSSKDFYLKDGDRVVFYGDSITEQKLYTTYIETYCISRFPDRHFSFVHSGWGGDRVSGGGGGPIEVRLKRDVIAYKPTVVTICLGMNDGGYRAFDQNIYDTYVNGYRSIIETLKKELPGVRLTLLTAPAFDDVTRPPSFPGGYNEQLVNMGKAVATLAKEYKLTLADTNAPMVKMLEDAKRSNPEGALKLIPDRVHPGPGGHLVMAAAVLKAWKAPSSVAEIEIDASRKRVVRKSNSKISDLEVNASGLSFTHEDKTLPWPLHRSPEKNPDMILALDVTGYDREFNDYRLKVTGLNPGNYEVKADGVSVGIVKSEDLSAGIDLAGLPLFPTNQQAQTVLNLTNKHNGIHNTRWRGIQMSVPYTPAGVTDEIVKKMFELDAQEAEVVKEEIAETASKPHKIEIVQSSN